MHSCADESRDSVTSTGVICKNYDKTDVKDGPAGSKHNRNKNGGLRPLKSNRGYRSSGCLKGAGPAPILSL